MVTKEMQEAGNKLASELYDVVITKALGGPKELEDCLAQCDPTHVDIIRQYLNEEIDSVTAIYIAMHRREVLIIVNGIEIRKVKQ